MAHITMTREDARRLVFEAGIEVRDPQGTLLGTTGWFMPEEMARQVRENRENPQPGIPEDKVREMLGLPKRPLCTA